MYIENASGCYNGLHGVRSVVRAPVVTHARRATKVVRVAVHLPWIFVVRVIMLLQVGHSRNASEHVSQVQ